MVNLERIKQRLNEYQEFSKNKKLESINLKDKILVDYIISNKEYPFQFEDELNMIKNMNDTDLLKFIFKENRWNFIDLFILKNDSNNINDQCEFAFKFIKCLEEINFDDLEYKSKYRLYILERLYHYFFDYNVKRSFETSFIVKMFKYLTEIDHYYNNYYNLGESLVKKDIESIINKIYQTISDLINQKEFSIKDFTGSDNNSILEYGYLESIIIFRNDVVELLDKFNYKAESENYLIDDPYYYQKPDDYYFCLSFKENSSPFLSFYCTKKEIEDKNSFHYLVAKVWRELKQLQS